MKFLKKIWEMAGTEKGSAILISVGCVPLTLINALLISESPELNAVMVALNCLLILWAVVAHED